MDVTPLECLSLQRVAEEALTNIVKHSHATVVQIRIYYENSALIMEVEDNGVGDVDLVNQAGLSVGLRSMSGCLERMNADMQIASRAGQTILKVIKNYG
ncbi:sensor histidine kinase [Acinetobacter sp. YH16042]|uniref:sensor histidine kinase n=1 Tax=Acinetobacter sp. YH16042 TaxID=2601186 RepID=UPI0015D10CC8|nr:ATP-binding protein [Acinetobacter sp. YH16042]